MLNTGNYVSSRTVLDGVASYTDIVNLNPGDVYSWIWDIINALNIPLVYIPLSTEIDIQNYRGLLPQNYHKDIQIREYYSKTPLTKSTNLFFLSPNKDEILQIAPHINLEGDTGFITTDNFSSQSLKKEYSYLIRDGWVYVEFQEGKVEMMYQAFPIDKHGFPMIPEDVKLIRAVRSFIIKNADYKAWRKGLISEAIYRDSEQESYYATAAAQSHANMPDLATMENIRRFSSLLVSDPEQFSKSFKFLNK